ncbi:hypothetical protein D3C73_1330270 [compost metagenome]
MMWVNELPTRAAASSRAAAVLRVVISAIMILLQEMNGLAYEANVLPMSVPA